MIGKEYSNSLLTENFSTRYIFSEDGSVSFMITHR